MFTSKHRRYNHVSPAFGLAWYVAIIPTLKDQPTKTGFRFQFRQAERRDAEKSKPWRQKRFRKLRQLLFYLCLFFAHHFLTTVLHALRDKLTGNVEASWDTDAECWYCCNLSSGVALNARFTTNGMCEKNNTHMYVVRTSNNRVIMACELYCCLLSQCEALRTCRSGFPIATITTRSARFDDAKRKPVLLSNRESVPGRIRFSSSTDR